MPVKGTRLLSEVYERADITTIGPISFEEAQAQEG